VHHSTIHKEKIQQVATIYQNFIFQYLYEAQHVQQPSTYEKPEAASAVSSS
jgi:hypothetical protein